MNRFALAVCGVATVATLATPGVADAATYTPFQLNPASFGNPNGSFDVPAFRCVVETGQERGTLRITGGLRNGWGCIGHAAVNWVNMSTGATGVARLSHGLNNIPPQVRIRTGVGQVGLALFTSNSTVTPGLATVGVR